MSKGRHVKWKLKFRVDRLEPGKTAIIEVRSAYNFRGKVFTFTRPECFGVVNFKVGHMNQFVLSGAPEIPCLVLHDQELKLDVAVIGISHVLEIHNMSEWALPFHAELHGIILLGDEEIPRSSDWEDVSMLGEQDHG